MDVDVKLHRHDLTLWYRKFWKNYLKKGFKIFIKVGVKLNYKEMHIKEISNSVLSF